jgi:hypothetical protein
MSIVIALIVVLVVSGLIAKFYPKQKQPTTLAQGETLTPEELAPETAVIIESLVESKVIAEAPKMDAKPKKKKQHYKKPAKKANA